MSDCLRISELLEESALVNFEYWAISDFLLNESVCRLGATGRDGLGGGAQVGGPRRTVPHLLHVGSRLPVLTYSNLHSDILPTNRLTNLQGNIDADLEGPTVYPKTWKVLSEG